MPVKFFVGWYLKLLIQTTLLGPQRSIYLCDQWELELEPKPLLLSLCE